MNFFKQAQEFAASAGVGQGGSADGAGGQGNFGNLLNEANTIFTSHTTATTTTTANPAAAANPQSGVAPTNTPPTTTELLGDTQVLYGALSGGGSAVDKTQAAGAAENLLQGLSSFGGLDKGQYGDYIQKAEGYLNEYGQPNKPTAPAPVSAQDTAAAPHPPGNSRGHRRGSC